MTYNIFDGGQDRLEIIIEAIKRESPDYLTISEASTFAQEDDKILKYFSERIGLPHYKLALSGEYDYHVAVFSRYSFKEIHTIHPLMRAGIVSLVETEIGALSIASLHLTPYSESLRLPEISHIIDSQKEYDNRILMGDMNSLAKYDNYDPEIIKNFNKIQLEKFTKNGEFAFEVIEKVLSHGYFDAARELKGNNTYTVPTPVNKDSAHADLRLDYIFVSKPLLPLLKKYEVVRNDLTDTASDHYPITISIE